MGTITAILETDDMGTAITKAEAAGVVKVVYSVGEVEGGWGKVITDLFGCTWIFLSRAMCFFGIEE